MDSRRDAVVGADSYTIGRLDRRSARGGHRRVALAATIGNILEWYDFLVYGFLSLTIAKLFFPAGTELGSLLLALATFGAGLVMRPIGALVLGIYADRVGRKAALSATMFLMALGTGLIAFAPTYQDIGLLAPVIVVLSRLLQGFSCGGELGGATAILVESAPAGRRGLYASWQTASQFAAFLLAALVNLAVSLALSAAQIEAGGWRIAFLLGLLIAPVGLYIRSKLEEPELFLAVRRARPVSPPSEMWREHGRSVLGTIGIAVLYVAAPYTLLLYMPTFAVRQLHLPFSQALIASMMAGCVSLAFCPVIAAISDRFGRKPLLLAAALVLGVLTYPAFALMAAHPSIGVLAFVQTGFGLLTVIYSSPANSVFAELFPTRVRSTAVALAYNLTAALVGGSAQLLVVWLTVATGNPAAPAFYVIGAAMVSAVSVMALRDRFRDPLS